jgi:adenine-specific DNA-methyltransferase
LIGLLLHDPIAKEHFFECIGDAYVLNQNKLYDFFNAKEYFDTSYTAYKPKIGLIRKDSFIKKFDDTVLAWPYKDCILEGGMSTEDVGKKEVFYNTIISKEEIDRLFEPKVLTNIKKFSTDGVSLPEEITMEDNLILKGNNLLALHSLKKRYTDENGGKIKLIYIDPPYNTGNDGFRYNDRFNHSTWLTFMKNRLEVAKKLLTKDGTIWINLDDTEMHYCKVLADEIFGRQSYIGSIAWKKTTGDNKPSFAFIHDNLLIYGNSHNQLPRHKLDDKQLKQYKNPDNDARGLWAETDYRSKWTKEERPNLYYGIKNPTTKEIIFPDTYSESTRVWACDQTTHQQRIDDKLIWWGNDGTSKEPKKKRFLSEHKGQNTRSVWLDAGSNDEASQHLKELFEGMDVFSNPKPEKLIQRIINITTNEGDIVLDYHLGSGTTAAVAHKMNRRYIGIEQMGYIETIAVERLKKVIEGEQGGISKAVGWNGGGSFVYAELKTIDDFNEADTIGRLNDNMRYLPLGEIDDESYGVSEDEKTLNKQFYGLA